MLTDQHAERPREDRPPPMDELELAAALVTLAHDQLADARRRLHRALERRSRRGGRQEGVCGTPAGYRRHQRAQEPPCVACMEAHSWDGRVRDIRTARVRRTA